MSGGGSNGLVAVAVVLPAGVERVRLVAGTTSTPDVVAFSDDGSFAFDLNADGEFWAILPPNNATTTVRIAGRIGDAQVSHTEIVEVPAAWRDRTYPVTLRATLEDGQWIMERTLGSPLPMWDGPTGAGLAGKAEQVGLSAPTLYFGWGAFVLALALTAAVRGAILRARRTLT